MSEKNIWIAAGEGDLPRVRHLVETEGLSTTVADEFTYTPVHAAASYGHTDVLRYLLTHPKCPADGANVPDDDGDTPLFVVEQAPTAEVLLELGADPEHKNLQGQTPLEAALENGYVEVAELLAAKTGVTLPLAPANDEDAEDARIARDLAAAEPADGDLNGSAAESGSTAERSEALYAAVEHVMQGAEARFRAAHPDAPADAQTELTPEEEARLKDLVGASVISQILDGWTRSQRS